MTSKHEQMREYLNQHGAFTIKDVLRVTRCNNPYRVIEHMKRAGVKFNRYDVAKKKTWFRVYYSRPREAIQFSRKEGCRTAPRRAR